MFTLVQEHESTLRVIERDIGDTTESVPTEYFDAVTVDLCPQERVLAFELIDTGKEEKFFKKVMPRAVSHPLSPTLSSSPSFPS